MHVRLATRSDAAAITTIYNEGIEDRAATFEMRLIVTFMAFVHPRAALWRREHGLIVCELTAAWK